VRGSQFGKTMFRRRTFTRRGRRPVHWVSDYWNIANSLNRLDFNIHVLCEYADFQAAGTLVKQMATVRRVVFDGGFRLRVVNQSEDPISCWAFGMVWMLLVADTNDGDLGVINTAVEGSLLHSARVLQCGVEPFEYNQARDAGTIPANSQYVIGLPKFQLDWRGAAKLGPDDVVYLITHCEYIGRDDDAVDNDVICHLNGYSRCLITRKGT